MFGKELLVILAIVCFTQEIYGEIALGVINGYKPIIKELSDRIGNTAKDSKTQVDTVQTEIKTNIDEGLKTIKESMNEIKVAIDEATKEAQTQGKSIKHCISTVNEEINTIDVDDIKSCDCKEEMNAINNAIKNMNTLQSATNKISKDCFWKYPWSSQSEKLISCIEQKTTEMEAAVSQETITVTSNLKTASKTHKKCIKNTTKTATKGIDKASKNFKKCVKKAFK